jgi:hypothetical protein
MKVPASHIRHLKAKRRFNEGKAHLETRRQVNKKRKP